MSPWVSGVIFVAMLHAVFLSPLKQFKSVCASISSTTPQNETRCVSGLTNNSNTASATTTATTTSATLAAHNTARNLAAAVVLAVLKTRVDESDDVQKASATPSVEKPAPVQKAPIVKETVPAYTFTHSLEAGMIDPGVLVLQKFLNSEGYVIASTGDGSPGNETDFFGVSTRQALINFQNAHAAILLSPYGQTEGDGILSGATESYINAQLAANG